MTLLRGITGASSRASRSGTGSAPAGTTPTYSGSPRSGCSTSSPGSPSTSPYAGSSPVVYLAIRTRAHCSEARGGRPPGRYPAVVDRVLARERWLRLSDEHAARVDRATEGHRTRRQAGGAAHPVEDFLFTYYPFRPGALRRWHPGPGVVLDGAASHERAHWRHYTTVGSDVRLDLTAYRRPAR